MDIERSISALGAEITTAQADLELAIALHETLRPAAHDPDVSKRMGKSFATNTFNLICFALRREILLALMRMWDTNKDSVRMRTIADRPENLSTKFMSGPNALP